MLEIDYTTRPSFLTLATQPNFSSPPSSPHPPPGALDLGRMMDGSVYFVVICHTGQGQIPGKAKSKFDWALFRKKMLFSLYIYLCHTA